MMKYFRKLYRALFRCHKSGFVTDSKSLLSLILEKLDNLTCLGELIMTTVTDVVDQVGVLKANATEVNQKLDLVIAKIDALQASGGGATAEQIAELAALIGETAAVVQSTEDKIDVELADAPTPEPVVE